MKTWHFSFALTELLPSIMTVNGFYCSLTWIQLSFQKIKNELIEMRIGRGKTCYVSILPIPLQVVLVNGKRGVLKEIAHLKLQIRKKTLNINEHEHVGTVI